MKVPLGSKTDTCYVFKEQISIKTHNSLKATLFRPIFRILIPNTQVRKYRKPFHNVDSLYVRPL